MKWLGLLCACLALCLAPCFSQDAPHGEVTLEEGLETLSSTIKDRLLSLRQESLSMREQLETLSASLETSQSEQAILAEQLMSSSASLTSINEELMSSYNSIARLELKVKSRGRIVLVLGIVFGAMICLKILGYILYAKGIKVPRWIDILI